MVRRSRLEIYFDVLEAIEDGLEKPTRIMYKTKLSWLTMHSAFDTLVSSGFVRIEKKKSFKLYSITENGRNALSHHRKVLVGFKSFI